MSAIYVRAILAGLLFGIWPLLMNKSGLTGNMSSLVFTAFAILTVAPFAMNEGFGSLRTAAPIFFISAGIVAGIALLLFNGMLSQATPKQVSSLFLISLMAQIVSPAIYHMYQNGIEPKKLAGITLAVLASILLG